MKNLQLYNFWSVSRRTDREVLVRVQRPITQQNFAQKIYFAQSKASIVVA